jgi:hypothetical protein
MVGGDRWAVLSAATLFVAPSSGYVALNVRFYCGSAVCPRANFPNDLRSGLRS